jgi:hypothetical protein
MKIEKRSTAVFGTIRLYGVPLVLIAGSLAAQTPVYKSIDAEGNVSYSSRPPESAAGVERVPLDPAPTESQRQQAEERVREMEQAAARMERERADTQEETSASVAAAEKELEEARAVLEKASVKTVDDWQTLAAGGRVLKQSYLDRVARAEERVRAAESALREVKRAR